MKAVMPFGDQLSAGWTNSIMTFARSTRKWAVEGEATLLLSAWKSIEPTTQFGEQVAARISAKETKLSKPTKRRRPSGTFSLPKPNAVRSEETACILF